MHKNKIKQIFSQEVQELFNTDIPRYNYAYVIDTNSYVVYTDQGLIYTRDEPALKRRLQREYNRYMKRVINILENAPYILNLDLYGEIWDDGFNLSDNNTILNSYTGINEHILIPPGVIQIVPKVFKEYDGLSATFNNDLKHIGKQAFYGWDLPQRLRFNQSLETVGEQAFYGWANLEEVILPETIQTIETEAFGNTPKLKEVIILNKIPPVIGNQAFGNNENLFIYVLPESVVVYKNELSWLQYRDRVKSVVERNI